MAQTIMIFDFGTNEEAAQQARHKIEGWKQGFRLGDKMLCKFEREDAEHAAAENGDAAEEKKSGKKAKPKKAGAQAKEGASGGRVRLLVRLGFSDHEKLSQQRWLDRIPAEEPFKSADGETIRSGDPSFGETVERFENLD